MLSPSAIPVPPNVKAPSSSPCDGKELIGSEKTKSNLSNSSLHMPFPLTSAEKTFNSTGFASSTSVILEADSVSFPERSSYLSRAVVNTSSLMPVPVTDTSSVKMVIYPR